MLQIILHHSYRWMLNQIREQNLRKLKNHVIKNKRKKINMLIIVLE